MPEAMAPAAPRAAPSMERTLADMGSVHSRSGCIAGCTVEVGSRAVGSEVGGARVKCFEVRSGGAVVVVVVGIVELCSGSRVGAGLFWRAVAVFAQVFVLETPLPTEI